MNSSQPWLVTDPFPAVPAPGTYGYFKGNKAIVIADPGELTAKLEARKLDGVTLGWTPADQRARPLYMIPAYRSAWLTRERKQIKERGQVGWLFIILGPFSFLGTSTLQQVWGALLTMTVLGVFPLISSKWASRELEEDVGQEFATRFNDDLFGGWIGQRPAPLGGWLAGGLVVLFLWMLIPPLFRDGQSAFDLAVLDRAALLDGEWWRALTVAALHGGLLHVVMNAGAAFALATLLERLTHRGTVALTYLAAVVVGSLASALVYRHGLAVGASGGIMGLAGLLLAYSMRHRDVLPHRLRRDAVRMVVLTGLLGIIAWGRIDNAAHAGGALAGWALGQWLPLPAPAETPADLPLLRYAGAAAIGVVLFSWGLTAWLLWPR